MIVCVIESVIVSVIVSVLSIKSIKKIYIYENRIYRKTDILLT